MNPIPHAFSSFVGVVVAMLIGVVPVHGSGWTDNFESYPLNQFPSANWVSFCGNTDMRIATDPLNPSRQVFRLHGLVGSFWAAGASRAYDVPERYTLRMRVYNGNETIPGGGHQVRAHIGTRQGICWTNPSRGYLTFHKNGTVLAADNSVLQSYLTGRWYDVRIDYDRGPSNIALQYWINGIFRGTVVVPRHSADHLQDRVELTAQAGTVFYDDVSVCTGPGCTMTNVALQANGGVASAISEGTYLGVTHFASYANDGDFSTTWTSHGHMPAWLQIEFDRTYTIERLAVAATYHQQRYSVRLSADGVQWATVVDNHLSSNVPTSVPTFSSAGTAYEVFYIPPTNARYMRVDVTSTTAPGSHIFKAMLSEVEAYASGTFTSQPQPPGRPQVKLPQNYNNQRNMVLVVHGCCQTEETYQQHWEPWVSELTTRLSNDWFVHAHEWWGTLSPSVQLLSTAALNTGLHQAWREGAVVGEWMAEKQFDNVHLIAHSAGSAMITRIACTIMRDSPNTRVQLTYLDAYVGVVPRLAHCTVSGFPFVVVQSLQNLYGAFSDWSDHYRVPQAATIGSAGPKLPHSHNINVERLFGWPTFRPPPAWHKMPACFYRFTISGNTGPYAAQCDLTPDGDYGSFGWDLSIGRNGSNWLSTVQPYPKGGETELPLGRMAPMRHEDEGVYDIREDSAMNLSAIPNFTGTPLSIAIDNSALFAEAEAASSAWINFRIDTSLPTNFIRFNVEFTSDAGAEGLLTTYSNGQPIGSLDEAIAGPDDFVQVLMHGDVEPGEHVLSFRLDHFAGPISKVRISNVATGWAGFIEGDPPIFGDLNGDGLVNVQDLNILVQSFGPCPPAAPCPADLNEDGVVDVRDLHLLLEVITPGKPGGPGRPK
jgi:hypothetical protein